MPENCRCNKHEKGRNWGDGFCTFWASLFQDFCRGRPRPQIPSARKQNNVINNVCVCVSIEAEPLLIALLGSWLGWGTHFVSPRGAVFQQCVCVCLCVCMFVCVMSTRSVQQHVSQSVQQRVSQSEPIAGIAIIPGAYANASVMSVKL